MKRKRLSADLTDKPYKVDESGRYRVIIFRILKTVLTLIGSVRLICSSERILTARFSAMSRFTLFILQQLYHFKVTHGDILEIGYLLHVFHTQVVSSECAKERAANIGGICLKQNCHVNTEQFCHTLQHSQRNSTISGLIIRICRTVYIQKFSYLLLCITIMLSKHLKIMIDCCVHNIHQTCGKYNKHFDKIKIFTTKLSGFRAMPFFGHQLIAQASFYPMIRMHIHSTPL